MSRRPRRDPGFTLPELLISVTLMALIASVVAMAVITSLRTAPDVTTRADSAIAVQGITTFLPPDVDSTEPDHFDTDPGRGSGCAGTDPGSNIVHMTWREEFLGSTTTFVANYRFVDEGSHGRIVRLTCSGQFSLGAPTELAMSAEISTTPPTVTLLDRNGDGKDDSLKVAIVTLSGSTVFIDAATKNPAETLPIPTTNPPTTTTTTTVAPNNPPVANPTSLTANPDVAVTFPLAASDPDGDALTSVVGSVPAGWVVSTSGTSVTLTPVAAAPGVYGLTYTVTDTASASASSTLTVTITTAATTTTTSTTTTTTTTTTTLPPCVVSSVVASPATVELQSNGTGKLKKDVTVTATVTGGYCIGLTLQYNTGGPNGNYVVNLGNAAPYQAVLLGHPQGTELWTTGNKVLQVRDSFNNLLGQTTLVVTN